MQVNRERKVPLYMQVYDNLKTMITEKKWQIGELLPSERELSTLFHVDRLTVRRALGMIAQEGLVEKVAGLGTRVTGVSLQFEENQNYRNLIFLLPKIPKNIISGDRLTEPFNSNLFFSVENECKKKGYNLIYTTISDDEILTEVLEGRRISGIFFVSKIGDKFLEEARRLKFPAVIINNEYGSFPTIRAARAKGTYEAVQYLIGQNHRQIGFISGIPSYITSRDCLEGFKRALSDAGLDWKKQLIKEGDWTFEGGFKAMQAIIAEQPQLPSAIFACNDMTAIGAMEALKTAGYAVPQDVSVIGFDGIEQGLYCSPKLTTVQVNITAMAKIACQHLFFALENRELQNLQIILPTELILRESTAPRRNK